MCGGRRAGALRHDLANDIEPTAYVADVLTRIGDAKTDEEIDALLPDRWTPAVDVKMG